ncbi:MAG: HNH endonuclease [Proteobacteria bacterium]|nr:HNH endonuclease [Pseudomonadota bacterium]
MDVLVLSNSYIPLRRVPWQQAFGYVFAGRAEIVETYIGRDVRSSSASWPMPSIVRFVRRTAGLFKRQVKFSRRMVYLRDGGRCQYCATALTLKSFTIDHIVPRSKGGQTAWENVTTACLPCNQKKADRTPRQAHMKLLTKPRKPRSLGGPGGLLRWHNGMPEGWKIYLGHRG